MHQLLKKGFLIFFFFFGRGGVGEERWCLHGGVDIHVCGGFLSEQLSSLSTEYAIAESLKNQQADGVTAHCL